LRLIEIKGSFIENVHNRKLSNYSPVKNNIKVYDTVIFEDYPDIDQKLWPAHCIEDTPGSELHPKLRFIDEKTDAQRRHVVITKKGNKSDIDSYSAFFDNCKLNETNLNKDLKKYGVTDIYVCGLAADVCVAATSMDGLSLKYRVAFIDDASRGVNLDDIKAKKSSLEKNGALIVNAKQVIKNKSNRTQNDRRCLNID
jgi:nicotinamidase-related amidase